MDPKWKIQFAKSTPLPKNDIPICMDKEKKYSNVSLQTKGLFGTFVANTSTEIKLMGANQTFPQPDNNFRPHQTQRRDLRGQGCLLSSTALEVKDRAELFTRKKRDFKKQLWAREKNWRWSATKGLSWPLSYPHMDHRKGSEPFRASALLWWLRSCRSLPLAIKASPRVSVPAPVLRWSGCESSELEKTGGG